MEKLGIDGKILLAQVVNFVILLVLFKKFLFQPFGKTLSEEEKKRGQLDSKLKEATDREKELYEQKLNLEKDFEKKIKDHYAKMKREADEAKKQILKEAKEEAEEIRQHNLTLIEAEKAKSRNELKKETYSVARAITEKVLREILNSDLQKQITAQIVDKLPYIKNDRRVN